MQLTAKDNITAALAAASCSLLSQTTEAAESTPWQFDTTLLYYDESGQRVKLGEAIISASQQYQNDSSLNLKFTADSLTGASPTGAVPQSTTQTFTRPSGKSDYRVAAGQIPLDNTFKDTRIQINADWTQAIDHQHNISSGLHFSKEYDYQSFGLNHKQSFDFNQGNTSASLTMALYKDKISPEGGRPKALSKMLPVLQNPGGLKQLTDANKYTTDLLLGVSQIISTHSIAQLNFGFSQVRGYQTDPFKLFSVVDNAGNTLETRHENRPTQRDRYTLHFQHKQQLKTLPLIIDFNYRHMQDSWQIQSNTYELKLNFQLSEQHRIEPQLRYYKQSAAEFYHTFWVQQQPLPQFLSADYRLANMETFTLGIKYRFNSDNNKQYSVRLAYYRQNPSHDPAVGQLKNYNLTPNVNAVILQLGYQFE